MKAKFTQLDDERWHCDIVDDEGDVIALLAWRGGRWITYADRLAYARGSRHQEYERVATEAWLAKLLEDVVS